MTTAQERQDLQQVITAGEVWEVWDEFSRTGLIRGEPVELDSATGRVLVGARLAYLGLEYEATGLSEVAWDAYWLAREQSFPLPDWVLGFIDSLAPQAASVREPQVTESAESRLEFQVAARVHGLVMAVLWGEGTLDAARVIAERTGRPIEWVSTCYSKHIPIVLRGIEFEGQEFLSSSDHGALGGILGGEKRRTKGGVIKAAIASELAKRRRAGDDDLPSIEKMWGILRRKYREPQTVEGRWRVGFTLDSERIWEQEGEKGREYSIARSTFPRYYAQVRRAMRKKV